MEQHKTTSRKLAIKMVGALAVGATLASQLNTLKANELNRTAPAQVDIIFTDSQSAVLRANIITPKASVVAAGQMLIQPFGVCLGITGELYVSDTGSGSILGINPQNGNQRLIASVTSNEALGMPFGIATDAGGSLLVANGQAVVRLNPQTGEIVPLTKGNYLTVPIGVAIAGNGNIFVLDALGAVVSVNPRTGRQTLITSGGYLNRPQGIVVQGDEIYVTDVATPDGNYGIGRIVHVNALTRQQSVLSEGGLLVGPVGITCERNGNLVVADPYTTNEPGREPFEGAILRINAQTGDQNLITAGKEEFRNPRCVVLVRTALE